MRRKRVLLGISATVLILGMAFGIQFASADNVQHGIGFTKGCANQTPILSPYVCTFTAQNTVDDAADTLVINELIDTVQAAGGDDTSQNIIRVGSLTTTDPNLGGAQSGAACFGFIRSG